MSDYVISCCSTADLSKEHFEKIDVHYCCFHYEMDGVQYLDDLGQSMDFDVFYQRMTDGAMTKTSQINADEYEEYFTQFLSQGKDIIHLTLSSGISGTFNSANLAKALLEDKYPDRKIYVIDSLAASSGYGLLVDEAADMRDRGCTMEEIEQWLLDNRQKVHHQFFSTDLKYFRRSGRVSGATATIGSILNICPIMRLDDTGHIIAYDKARGKKRAIQRTIQEMEKHAENGLQYSGKCWICHSNCLADAQETKEVIRQKFPNISEDIRICDIGTIIASHCGPGTVAVFFFGDERAPYPEK